MTNASIDPKLVEQWAKELNFPFSINEFELQLAQSAVEYGAAQAQHRIRVHLANRYQYSHAEFCTKLEKILAAHGAAQAQPVASGKHDEFLLPFMKLMEKELRANSAKGDRPGWLSMAPDTCLLEIYWHTAKLSAAVKNKDAERIAEHSADVANMSMMLLDICGGLLETHP